MEVYDMISETMDKIVFAENQAAEKVDLANKKSKQIIFEANEKAKEIIFEGNRVSQAEIGYLIQKTNIQINEIIENSNTISLKEASEIRVKAQAKSEKAINIVMAKIIDK